MNKIFLVCIFVIGCSAQGESAFDLKAYERSLKKYIPWSLTGTAQDLRSDAKHQLQLMLRSFVLLRPEATWDDPQGPTLDAITKGFNELHTYLAQKENEGKRSWVADSIDYIANSYVPEVQKLLDSAQPEGLSPELAALLDKKRALLKEFSKSLVAGQEKFAIDSDRMA